MNKRMELYLIEEEIDDIIDYSRFSPSDAERLKEFQEQLDEEMEELYRDCENTNHLTKDPEYMRNVWYQSCIDLGWEPKNAKEFADKKVKERFGI